MLMFSCAAVEWNVPIQDNVLRFQLEILEEYSHEAEEPWYDDCHQAVCRQIGGGN